ncbi:MAG: glucose 1-dehydrogenase [Phycisphaeraceae bacterium]|nr:glucose 1-dehydrogenase [Phycisphaeraceae bacterium]
MKLQNKVAIITGGTRGIGLGCAQIFAKHGSTVVVASHDHQAGKQVQEELIRTGATARFIACDVTIESQMIALVEQTIDTFGQLDCIINNAGWHPPAMTIDQISVEDFQMLINLNLTSTFMGCKFALPHLLKTQGSIINMSSEVGLIGQEQAVSYVSSKSGQVGLTKALALDLAPQGVRVNAVCPAGVMTPLMQEWADTQYDPEAALQMVDSWHPIGRMANTQEIGEVCAFLASSEAAFMTGQVICPDGGAALGYRR